jgi:cytochrome oxidase Cu insertion factor (SCO1/SenC/PrrC family)
MSTHPSSAIDSTGARSPRIRPVWLAWAAALVVGVAAGGGVALLVRSHGRTAGPPPAPALHDVATWAAGVRRAPDFHLVDQHGTAFSLGGLRGRSVIVTFIDPLCRNLCPLEARVLDTALRQLPPARRPQIVAVSVNPWGDTAATFAEDRAHWQLPADWRWGVGTKPQLAAVWRDYAIGVQVATKKLAGVTVRDVSHTEASYVVDASGHERALLLYPFRVSDVVSTLRRIDGA